jgi:hypothetical protein
VKTGAKLECGPVRDTKLHFPSDSPVRHCVIGSGYPYSHHLRKLLGPACEVEEDGVYAMYDPQVTRFRTGMDQGEWPRFRFTLCYESED